jgi:hypothetical protein
MHHARGRRHIGPARRDYAELAELRAEAAAGVPLGRDVDS